MIDPETGEVDRETIFVVLRFHKVEISPDPKNLGAMLLVRGDIVESKMIPEAVGRRLVQYLKRRFDIPVHHFYRPEMMASAPNGLEEET
jgi:hypothetical protein